MNKRIYKLTHFLNLLITLSFFITSCVPVSRLNKNQTPQNDLGKVNNNGTGNGKNFVPSGNGNVGTIVDTIIQNGKPSVQQVIDPFDGAFKTKVTIPKNFAGSLYLTGLNILSLRDKFIYVRFYLGTSNEMIELPATVGRAPGGGIISNSDIQAIMIDMSSQPFKDVRLLYDLYDYNNYDTAGTGEFSSSEIPVSDPRDVNVYCRGLNLQDDHTFSGAGLNGACDTIGESCKYSYAKVLDRNINNSVANKAPINFSGGLTLASDVNNYLMKSLPETSKATAGIMDLFNPIAVSNTEVSYGDILSIGGTSYTYRGPYMFSNYNSWGITGDALFGPSGIFKHVLKTPPACTPDPLIPTKCFVRPPAINATIALPTQLNSSGIAVSVPENYSSSLKFPRYGKMDLTQGMLYLGTLGNPNTPKAKLVMSVAGKSGWMDGSSIRTSTYNNTTGENIGSCNVTGRIEIVSKDINTNVSTVLDTVISTKIQLTRKSQTDYFGQEVLFTSLKSCSSVNNAGCGSNECCFNNRCWSKDIVAQCAGDVNPLGNQAVGTSCKSDYECASLCCDQNIGKCNVHQNSETNKVLCGKSPGQSCVANEWCKEESVNTCFIVKNGTDINGNQACTLRCYPIKTSGICMTGKCQPPVTPVVPAFDPLNPDCSTAIDPPQL